MIRAAKGEVMLSALLRALAAIALILSAQPDARAAPQANAPVAEQPSQELLGRLVGHWVLTGTIAGQSVTHEVDAGWTLQRHYLRLDEVSRERDAHGLAQYEATIFIGWLDDHYVCLWLDNTGVASGDITCRAMAAPDALPFEFRDAHGALQIATTFRYNRADDTWTWRIDNIQDGRTERFADLTMRRR